MDRRYKMFKKDFINLLKGSFPLIHINSREYDRVVADIIHAVESEDSDFIKRYMLYIYDTVNGLMTVDNVKTRMSGSQMDIEDALIDIAHHHNSIFIVKNLNLYWEDSFRKGKIIDALYNIYHKGLTNGIHLVNISNSNVVTELSDYFVVIDYPLPDENIIHSIVSGFVSEYDVKIDEHKKNTIVNLCKGMSKAEIDNALTISYIVSKDNSIDIDSIKKEKAKIVKKTGLLEWIEEVPSIDDIGGLDNLKEWFKMIAKVIQEPERANKYGLKMPKGCLLCGISGTGKTLSAKAIASLFNLPLFRLDVGKLFGSLVGETEKNTREVLKIIDAMSPCVVLIDEIEKALSGLQSSGYTDSGVTARVIGSFLYYLQEKKTLSYFVCTANNINALPTELLRKGRFDEIWYVGLPSSKERLNIWKIHLAKSGRDIKKYNYRKLVNLTSQFTGAEIEAVISQALYKAFYEDREPTDEDFISVISETTPFAILKSEYISQFERWAIENKVRKANVTEVSVPENLKRKISN